MLFSAYLLCATLTVASLKSSYIAYRNELGETGQGLVDEEREDEIIPGTLIDNTWRGL